MQLFGRWTVPLSAFFRKNPSSENLTLLEPLEPRRLLAASIPGYTPAQIRHAYGFDQISLGDGSVPANGAGQTIAIVDAFNDPKIAADLNVFDQQFGLQPADLQVVNQTGGHSLPSTDAGWAGEIALDVEWAHAIAPAAKILLVEADSSSITDLITAVDYARHAAGVSTVSMSWGGSEFFSWSGGESDSQTNFDPIFTTPAGHQGVTFFAAAGDSGAVSGVQWPSSSPNVVSVGGTSLITSDATGTYADETGWSGTNGGFSQVEAQPISQNEVQASGVRTTPDVSYDADPNTGFAVYDSLAFEGESGWQEVGGTSAGAPQWAALVAIADEGRALRGLGTLDGATQTLPALYANYNDAQYDATFDDVLTGGGTLYHHRWGGIGQTGYTAQRGYDLVTGLGSPKAQAVVADLVATDPSGAGGGGAGGGSGGGGGSNAANLPVSPISAVFKKSPVTAFEGSTGKVKLKLIDTSGRRFKGPVTITLYASADGAISGDDTVLYSKTLDHLSLKAGHSETIKLHPTYPMGLPDGAYAMLASVDAPASGAAPATAAAPAPVAIAAPRVDLSTGFASITGDTAKLTVTNLGNVTAAGALRLFLYDSPDTTLDSADAILGRVVDRQFALKAGESVTFKIHFRAPAAGNDLIASTGASTIAPVDSNSANNVAAVAFVG